MQLLDTPALYTSRLELYKIYFDIIFTENNSFYWIINSSLAVTWTELGTGTKPPGIGQSSRLVCIYWVGGARYITYAWMHQWARHAATNLLALVKRYHAIVVIFKCLAAINCFVAAGKFNSANLMCNIKFGDP